MASLEFGVPAGGWYPAWWLWTRVGLPAGGMVAGGGWFRTGRFLGPSIERFWDEHPLEQVLGWWADAGMLEIRAQRLSVGGGVIIRGTKP
jgi:demethylmenaquinone methyltransferase/2-methoxy-6-polyprenyl-1,4-benzoquinol methylase